MIFSSRSPLSLAGACLIMPFLLAGCGKDKDERKEDYNIRSADPQVSHRKPLWLSSLSEKIQVDENAPAENQNATVLGYLSAEPVSLRKRDGRWLLKGKIQLVDVSGDLVFEEPLVVAKENLKVSGEWVGVSGELTSAEARLFSVCLVEDADGECDEIVLDIFRTYQGMRHAVQLVGSLSGRRRYSVDAVQSLSAVSLSQKYSGDRASEDAEAEGVDPEEYNSVFVGHLFADLNNLQPVKDQVIGLPNGGYMQNSSSLKSLTEVSSGASSAAPPIRYVHPSRTRYYGSFEMMEVLARLAVKSAALPRAAPIWVGDISLKNGGRITNSAHKSHQNGLDVDLAYPMNKIPKNGFISIFRSNGSVDPDFQKDETWELFKGLWAMDVTDRIFVGARVKRLFCQHALAKGEKEVYTQLLRRMRPTPGHDNHYHLRIRCTPNQPRCRMIGPPPAGPGC